MLLSLEDIKRIQKIGFPLKEFAKYDRQGYLQLRNRSGYCVFYDKKNSKCNIYENRPMGCRLYPVIVDEVRGIVLDEICESRKSVACREKVLKGKKVVHLLQVIDFEARERLKENAPNIRRNPTHLNKP